MDRIAPFQQLRGSGRVLFGCGRIAEVPEEARRLGSRVALISAGSARRAADAVAAALGRACAVRLDGAPPHVPEAAAGEAAARVREAGADVVVSIGGGSATGLAKAVALDAGLPVLAVPTTYAGSEMTPIWGRTRDGVKVTGRDPRVQPTSVVYDPDLTAGLPPAVRAASGMNALAQAIAPLVAPEPSPLTALIAVAAVRELCAALPEISVAPEDPGAREHALYGAFLAGSALAAAPTGLHHRLAHVIGGRYGLPHAGTHSALLPHVVAFHEETSPDRLVAARSAASASGGLGVALFDLARRIGAPTSLAQLGLDNADLAAVAAEIDPSLAPPDRLAALLAGAHAGRRPPHPDAASPRRAGPAPWLDQPEQATWRAWLDTYRLVLPTLDRQLRSESGVSLTDYEVLVALSEAPGGRLRMAHVADRTVATRSAVTRTVDRLARRGWVCRAPSPDDQRGQYAELTDLGWQTIRTLAPGHVRSVRDTLIDLLDPADLAAVQRIGERVRARLERGVGQNPRDEPGGAHR